MDQEALLSLIHNLRANIVEDETQDNSISARDTSYEKKSFAVSSFSNNPLVDKNLKGKLKEFSIPKPLKYPDILKKTIPAKNDEIQFETNYSDKLRLNPIDEIKTASDISPPWTAKDEASFLKARSQFYDDFDLSKNDSLSKSNSCHVYQDHDFKEDQVPSSCEMKVTEDQYQEEVNKYTGHCNLVDINKRKELRDENYPKLLSEKNNLIETLRARLLEKDEEIFCLTVQLEKLSNAQK